MQAFLELNFWLPIATFSYSMYIWHYILLTAMDRLVISMAPGLLDSIKNIEAGYTMTNCIHYTGWWVLYFFLGLIPTFAVSTFSYVFVEKPSIDSRRVFKNKYAT